MNRTDDLVGILERLWQHPQDRILIAECIRNLSSLYGLELKLAHEPEVADIIQQMSGRLAKAYDRLTAVRNKKILDIACGSNTSKLPSSAFLKSLPGGKALVARQGNTALFEPWFCRMLFQLGAVPVGIDFGDLQQEAFIHYKVDLGEIGALDFLPDHSFDGIQDSRLFGSPEFTALFPHKSDRLKIALEIVRQEQRLLKPGGIMIHSDAIQWVR